jgi:DNA polymerase-3 subunit chi
MTRVDFYLLNNDPAGGRDTTALKDVAVCRLTNKAFLLGHRVYIHAADTEQAQRLDALLWTFSAGSFIPHAFAPDADDTLPVVLGQDEPPEAFDDVLITLAPDVPAYFSRFRRVAEVVGDSDEDKRLARERFRFYRERGYELQTHHLGGERP